MAILKTEVMTEAQAGDLEAALEGVIDRFIAITAASASVPLTPGDQTLSALGGVSERLIQSVLERLEKLGEIPIDKVYERVTYVAAHSAVAHVAGMEMPLRAHFALHAAKGLQRGLNDRKTPCDCDRCKAKRQARPH